jgi:hypothetical protein
VIPTNRDPTAFDLNARARCCHSFEATRASSVALPNGPDGGDGFAVRRSSYLPATNPLIARATAAVNAVGDAATTRQADRSLSWAPAPAAPRQSEHKLASLSSTRVKRGWRSPSGKSSPNHFAASIRQGRRQLSPGPMNVTKIHVEGPKPDQCDRHRPRKPSSKWAAAPISLPSVTQRLFLTAG